MRNIRIGVMTAGAAVIGFGLVLGAKPTAAQYYYACPAGYYYAQGYGCVPNPPPPPPVYYYAPPPPPPPIVYPAPLFGFSLGFGFGGHDHDHDHDWHGGWHH